MKKFVSLSLILCVFIVFSISSVFANNKVEQSNLNELSLKSLEISPTLTISKFSDGRVAPVKNVSNFSEKELDSVLKEMDFNSTDLQNINIQLKKDIVKNGGIKVDFESSNVNQYYNSLDGIRYLITEENKDDINEIKKKDIQLLLGKVNELDNTEIKKEDIQFLEEKLNELDNSDMVTSSNIYPIDMVMDGKLFAQAYLVYQGKTPNNNEHKFNYYLEYNWSEKPNLAFTDVISQQWHDDFSRISSTGVNYYKFNNSTQTYTSNFSVSQPMGGAIGRFDLILADNNYGHLSSQLFVSVSRSGDHREFYGNYSHPWTNTFLNVAFSLAGINVDSFWGDEYEFSNAIQIPY